MRETYCGDCGCPVNEHDDEGVCRALDLPEVGIENNCVCMGLVVPLGGESR